MCPTIWHKDFSNGCNGQYPPPVDPVDLTSVLPTSGLQELHFYFRDQCGGNEGSSNIFLEGAGAITGVNPPATGFCGLILPPLTATGEGTPLAGANHTVTGMGYIHVDNKQNCFATGQITLVTKVCHGFGIHHCRDRTIATSGVLNLPVAGDIIRTLSARCRSGTNSYKVHVNVHWVEEEADVEDGLPIISYSGKDEDTESPYVKITC